jgi:single-strand DNA-binding protein
MYQKLVLVGNVGKDPEMRYTPSGSAVTSFSLATNSQYTNQAGEAVKETTWFRVTTWGKQAEVCNQYVKKGMTVLVEGKMTPDKTTGGPRVYAKKDGTSAASFEVNASTVRFLSHKEAAQESTAGEMPINEDDIPF